MSIELKWEKRDWSPGFTNVEATRFGRYQVIVYSPRTLEEDEEVYTNVMVMLTAEGEQDQANPEVENIAVTDFDYPHDKTKVLVQEIVNDNEDEIETPDLFRVLAGIPFTIKKLS